MTIRLTLILAVTLTGITTVLTHHDKRPGDELLAASAPLAPLPRAALARATRAERRLPLRVKPTPRVWSPLPRVARSGSHHLHDVTMYCATGNRNAAGRWPQVGDVAVMDRSIPFGTRVLIGGRIYTVEDWIGWGSEYDLFGGNDPGCEQRALNFGRQHLPVTVLS